MAVKKIILSAAAVAILAGFSVFVITAWGQTPKPAPTAAALPHKIGLIDMAHVFKEYKKFEMLREDLKGEITQSDQKAKTMAEGIKTLQEQLKSKTVKEGSPDYERIEKELLSRTADFEAFRKSVQRDFMRKEAEIYKTIYLEVSDAVEKYADYYKYTLIMRFNRDGLETGAEPAEVIQRMNRQVVYFRGEDDITESVLDFLNRKYAQVTGNPTGGPARN